MVAHGTTVVGARATTLLEEIVGELPGAELRASQVRMVEVVTDAIASRSHVIVRAGTGTGKSLGYLVAIAANEASAAVATHTKTLQDQLVAYDLPRVAAHLSYGVLKGRSNYPCYAKLHGIGRGPASGLREVAREVFTATLLGSSRGEVLERSSVPIALEDPIWGELSTTSEECLRKRCAFYEQCVAEQARHRALEAQVVVANQALLGVDLRSFGQVLGPRDVVVLDEAHEAPGSLSSAFEIVLGWPRVSRVLTGLERALSASHGAVHAWRGVGVRAISVIEQAPGRLRRGSLEVAAVAESVRELGLAAESAAVLLRSLDAKAGVEPAAALAARQGALAASRLSRDCVAVVAGLDGEDDNQVLFAETGRLHATPIEVGALLAERLWSRSTAVVVSATVPASLGRRLGLGSAEVVDLGWAFDHRSRSVLYVPETTPDPARERDDHARFAREEMLRLVRSAGGRALLLFTSHAAMRAAYDEIGPEIAAMGVTVYVQGCLPRSALLEAFRREETSTLFATRGYFGGLDVPGRSCVLVVIDKLPFPVPGGALLEARRERAGAGAFVTVDLEDAGLALAQASGRLMRRHDDSGVVCVLDPRLVTRRYGPALVDALPPMRRTRDSAAAYRALELAVGGSA
ncbi:MAG: ATP-dependent DNA helicase [Acidimicrobiales bacterium]